MELPAYCPDLSWSVQQADNCDLGLHPGEPSKEHVEARCWSPVGASTPWATPTTLPV